MLHFSCDICGKDLTPGVTTRFVVKMDVFAATEPTELTEDDTDADPVEEMARLLTEQEENDDELEPAPVCKKMQFDLCLLCHRKFIADPLGRESAAKLHFSEN
jgi:hypothetical protein